MTEPTPTTTPAPAPAEIGAGTAAGLLAFLDFLVQKGYASESAVTPWKSAARQIFAAVEGERYGSVDVRSIDVDEYADRFENLVVGRYKQESLASYRSRFKKAINSYLDYLDRKAIPAFRASARTPRSGERGSDEGISKPSHGGEPPPSRSPTLVNYPFPLRSGDMAYLHLPLRLDRTDAERLATFVRSLVLDPQRELGAAAADRPKNS